MAQVLSWRFVAALGALVLAALLVYAVFGGGPTSAQLATPFRVTERRPQLIAQVLTAQGPGFALTETGQATADLVLTLAPDDRSVRIFAGTPGQQDCPELGTSGRCAVLAELLGDTITWFALVPMTETFRFQLPAIVELDGGLAQLTNGWELPYARVIDRSRCNFDESFGEFLRTIGTEHRSIFDLGDGEITAVTCPQLETD